MSKNRRILVELLAPPLLAAVALVAASYKQETLAGILLGFVPLVMAAYVLGFIPSLLYTGAMELWFRSGLRVRFGLLCTVLLSACLGAGAGFLSAVLGAGLGFSEADRLHLLRLGAVVGLLIGFYVGREQTPTAQPNGLSQ
jgi:hypothetical protein